ncbi:microfibril-associated glycoprotein 4-like isoform X1 [Astyanax mexicanus]|uniref:microfibril-associated glycoprotein 4-like isoform X1 n=1 Tax=Astyanax mexicanus TaxID=7994 RepID=UPI0020CB0DBD|nr:microfibril-associated glycoprotein 4-like isoform X1 [Astyanax mexicanus]
MTAVVFVGVVLPLLVGSVSVTQGQLPVDCSDIYNQGQTLSGLYSIYPTGESPVQVYCDMGCSGYSSQDGRWTVIQRRMDGVTNFYRPWIQYRNGFGSKDGEHWLGLETIYQMTQKKKYELRVDLEDFQGGVVHAKYSSFSIDPESDGYRLHVSGYADGGAGDALVNHDGQKFSTFDKDQDSSSENCALLYFGAFWYNNCHHANINGVYMWGAHSRYGYGVIWNQWKGFYYSLKSVTMKIRPINLKAK